MIDFSLIMPVRNNIKGLCLTLGAFQLFTHKKDKFEIILLVDNDDPDRNYYMYLPEEYKLNITVKLVTPSDNFSNDYYNWALQHCRGTNIMVWNDDCYVQTDGWDDIVREKIAGQPQFNGVYLVDMWDSTRTCEANGLEFARFPVLSRTAVDAVGFFFVPTVRNWPADYVIWSIYNRVGCIIPCHGVKLQHDHNYDHVNDPSKSRFQRILNEDKANGVFPVKADEYIIKLIGAIDGKQTSI
jgi:hypothetical protein